MQTASATRPKIPISRTAAVLACVVLLAAGGGGGEQDRRPTNDGSAGGRAGSTGDQNSVSTGSSAPADSQGRTAGTFSVEFAKCMRANGVPNFPDPSGQAGQLGPASGIDPASAPFQAALNGACKSLAPPAWLDSDAGPGSVSGGGS